MPSLRISTASKSTASMDIFLNISYVTASIRASIENRARLIFEVLEAVPLSLPSSKVDIRLSLFGDTFGCNDSNPCETFMYGYVVNKLNNYDLAYLHIIEHCGMHAANVDAPEGGVARLLPQHLQWSAYYGCGI
ncbi:NADH:flavin oxidoreductase / NADH oxidase family [Phytophthora infestans]|uniref:NADH:flavin oxidoreductase / NADH oxidase family n=1 Tax=Phytophthora infestans TaxID=4787 RepID=A0A833TGG3_PHYIN|nr:NADH:flavin oxidoreductase / NADH oxidase family [Phytophthora infestans]